MNTVTDANRTFDDATGEYVVRLEVRFTCEFPPIGDAPPTRLLPARHERRE